MGVYIKPCHGCPIGRNALCEQREAFRAAACNVPLLRSASFKCPIIDSEVRPGRRVVVSDVVVGMRECGRYEPDYEAVRRSVPATITAAGGGSFACVIDKGEISQDPDDHADGVRDVAALRFRKRMPIRRIERFLDEPDAEICDFGNVVRGGRCERSDKHSVCCREAGDLS